MIDYDKMSDEDVIKAYEAQAKPEVDYDTMSDEDVMKAYEDSQIVTPNEDVINNMQQATNANPLGFREKTSQEMLAPDLKTGDEVKDEFVQRAENFQTGTAATFLGGYTKILDWADRVPGVEVDRSTEEAMIKSLNMELEQNGGDGIFTAGTLGRLAPSMATLPIAVKSKMVAFFMEGGIGAAEARGEGASEWMSEAMGLLAGLGTAAVMGAVDWLTKPKVNKLYTYIKKHNNISDEAADEIFTNWAKIMDEPDTPANRTKAIVDSLGKKGADLKIEAAAGSPSATQSIEGGIKARREAVDALTDGSKGIEFTADSVAEAADNVKVNYTNVKDAIADAPSTLRLDIPDALDEITAGDARAVKEIFEGGGTTVKDLIDAMPHVNSLLRRTKGVTKHQWSVVKDAIDANLKKSLTKVEYDMWRLANQDYAKMSNVTNSKIGDMMNLVKQGKETPENAIKKIKTMSGGKDLFTDLEFMIGKEQTAAFEKSILKEALGKNSEYVDWAHLARVMDTKGFTTEVGKNIKKAVDDMAVSFITDDALQEVMFRNAPAGAGMSDNLINKVQFHTMHKLYTSLVKRIPFNEASKHLLMMDELADVLRNPGRVKDLAIQMKNIAPGVKQRFIEESVQEVMKQIEYKPGARTTGDVNLKPEYVAKGGTAADTPTAATLAESQTELIQEALGSNVKTDQVMHVVNKMMKGKRAEGILRNVSSRMKVDDVLGNQKMLRKIIKEESEHIIKAIEKDMGIKLPAEEAEKIYKLKIADMLKDC